MDATTFVWTIAATILAGVQVFTSKIVAHNKGDSALNSVFTYGLSGLIVCIVWIMHPHVPADWVPVVVFGVLSGFVHGLGNVLRIDALTYIDSTVYFPLNKVLGPLFVVCCGVLLLGEHLTRGNVLGVFLSLLVPLLLISTSEHHRQNNLNRGLVYVVLSTLLTAGSMVMVKMGVVHDDSIIFMMLMSQIGGVSMSLVAFMWHRPLRTITHMDAFTLRLGIVTGIASFASYYAMLVALHTGLVSLVYTIHAHYILIPILLSVWWYKEHINVRKLAAVALSCITITLLS